MKQFDTIQMGAQEAIEALRGKQFYRRAGVNLIDIHRPGEGGVTVRPDLPWLNWPWMAYFLVCLRYHGREDCQCWRIAMGGDSDYLKWLDALLLPDPHVLNLFSHEKRKTWYRGSRLSEIRSLIGTVYEEAWLRERGLAMEAFREFRGEPEDPNILVPWTTRFFALLESGEAKSPAAAAGMVGQKKHNLSMYRNTKPWFNARLEKLGFKRMPWMSKSWRSLQERAAWKELKKVQV